MKGLRPLVRTLKRFKLLRMPDKRRGRYVPRALAPIPDVPRVPVPFLADALRSPGQVRWLATCATCGVKWTGVVRDVQQPTAVLATLAVLRVPCPVCWALAWVEADQATRAAWSAVPSWLTPRWR
jgi:hypothetical protein